MYHIYFVYLYQLNGYWELNSFEEPCFTEVATITSFTSELNPMGVGGIYYHPQTDSYVVSQLFSVARHAKFLKPTQALSHWPSMADTALAGGQGGFRSEFRGRGRGRGYRWDRGRGANDVNKEWVPINKLGHLVKDMKIHTLEEIYLFLLPIKEAEIIDFFLGSALKYEVLKIMPVRKQTYARQRTRFKAYVAISDHSEHVGLGIKCSKKFATAIRGAIVLAKLSIIPARWRYWGNKIGKAHTVPCNVVAMPRTILPRRNRRCALSAFISCNEYKKARGLVVLGEGKGAVMLSLYFLWGT